MLKKKGFEVLYMTDSIDQWAVDGLREYNGKKLVDALQGELELPEEDEAQKEKNEALEPLTTRFQEVLKDDVAEVRLSKRLAESPACLVTPEGGIASHIERLLREQNQAIPEQKRILELNPNHPLIEAIDKLSKKESADEVNQWVELIYDQALLAEGSPIKEPAKFAQRLTGLMQEVAKVHLQ
jgi:molecular chaperone HtpG